MQNFFSLSRTAQALLATVSLAIGLSTGTAIAQTAQALPFSQNWNTTTLITTLNDWTGVPGIIGYRGDNLTAATATDPQTIIADGSATPVNVTHNALGPNTTTSGGIYEFDTLANPVVAMQGSGTADAPFIQIAVNTTGAGTIVVSYNLRDIDGSIDNAVQPVALQYRIGSVGDFTNLPAGFVADASSGPSLATLVTAVTATLPASCDNQSIVYIRIITANAIGNDELIGIDDISITGGPLSTNPNVSLSVSATAGTEAGTTAITVTATASAAVTSSETVTLAVTGNGITAGDYTLSNTTITILSGATTGTATFTIVNDTDLEGTETAVLTISNPSSGIVIGTASQNVTIEDNDNTLVITEAHSTGSSTTSYAADWFEITNTGTAAVSIAGWKIDDSSNSFALAGPLAGVTSIAPGQSVIFMDGTGINDALFTAHWFGTNIPLGFTIGSYTGTGLGLSSSGDAVNLFNDLGNPVTGVSFGAATTGVSFDNAAGLTTITQLSVVGVNGAINSVTGSEIGSPGKTNNLASFDFDAATFSVVEGSAGGFTTNGTVRVNRTGYTATTHTIGVSMADVTATGIGTAPTTATAQVSTSSATPYVLPTTAGSGVNTTSLLTVGDAIGGYQMVGIADGLGAYDNNNGTFTLLMNHELGSTVGAVRAHGATGAFVSKWVINKSDMRVLSGSDLIQEVYGWNSTTQTLNTTPTPALALNRFCSADLPAVSAFYNATTGLGTQERIFMHGEEGGSNGYQLATVATGTNAGKAYILGNFNLTTNGSGLTGVGAWENAVASPFAQNKTIVVGLNDGGTGIMNNSVAVYVGTKTNTGNEVERAGLANGTLKFINVTGSTAEIVNTTTRATNITSGTAFTLSATAATTFSRPEDGTWNPQNAAQFFFVTTDRLDQVADGVGTQIGRSRLWRLTFTDITNPDLGGTIDMLLDGTEGGNMFDNLTIDGFGHLTLQEDPGNADHNAKFWMYDIATDALTLIAKHDPARFGDVVSGVITAPTAPYTKDEESSGIIDMQHILGAGWNLFVTQAHYPLASPLVEGGQLQALFNPTTYNSYVAAHPADYRNTTLTATFAPGATFVDVQVPVVADVLLEGNETFNLSLTDAGTDAAIGTTHPTAVMTIVDDELPFVNIATSTSSATEAGATAVTVYAIASANVTTAESFALSISGTGITSSDYSIKSTTITIPAGQKSGWVTLNIADDVTPEATESMILTISSASTAVTLVNTIDTVTILNNNCSFIHKVGGIASTNGAEIPAFDPASKHLFTVAGPVIEEYSMDNAGALTLIGSLPTGFTPAAGTNAVPNSVAVKDGVLAAAYAIVDAATSAQQNGMVSFYTAATGAFINSVQVGFLPDMLIFTPDGKKVLTANEGEPNSYGQGTSFDPEGSVSIIDVSNGAASATVSHATFTSFNSQAAALKASGVRIYGPGATVAQDMEPEYIAFDATGDTAYVTLQENNAIAIVDIATSTVLGIAPLGLKDHSAFTVNSVDTFMFANMPVLGTTAAGQNISLGGFSGLSFEGYAANGNLMFVTHTDRGPNGEPTGINRPFMLPNFAPEVIRFEQNPTSGQLSITQRIQLKKNATTLLTGLPNTAISSNGNTAYNDEVPVDLFNATLGLDPMGADLEGIVVAGDGSFWMVDEYRPAIYHFDSTGVMQNRFVPIGTAAAAGQPAGTFGTEVLPAVLAQRRQNRGFEAVAFKDGKLYAFVQSPLRNPASVTNTALNGMTNVRVVEFDVNTSTTTAQYIYQLDNANLNTPDNTRPDKIGDAVYMGNGNFLVVERDDDALGSGDPLSNIEKKIYRFSLAGAANVNGQDGTFDVGGGVFKSVDQMTAAELTAAGFAPIAKTLHVDLATAGYNSVEKVEGLAMIDMNTLAVINDNDFEMGGIVINNTTGTFTPSPSPQPIVLGIISTSSNALDASDRDVNGTSGAGGKINIQNWPIYGMYQPDAIAGFTVGGQRYFITANEGDTRNYTGFSEEARVSTLNLDAAAFPNATTLKLAQNLGRLQLTNATGDLDNDGDFDQLHANGARSFTIWGSDGSQIFDSGDQLEQITSARTPVQFNSDGSSTSFDTRSDNKGPEPEGVTVGEINGRTYAFVGMERVGDIMVYDVTNPAAPVFVQYINTPEDISTEGLTFVSAANSPTGKPLLITTQEVSLTVAVFEIQVPEITVAETSGTANDGIFCPGTAATLYATPGASYAWSNGANSDSIVVTAAGTYSVNVTSATGCTRAASFTVSTTDTLKATVSTIAGVKCNGGTADVKVAATGASPFTYAWSNATTNDTLAGVVAGTYQVTTTDVNGCVRTDSIVVTQPAVLASTASAIANACKEGNTGKVSLTTTGGTPAYQYLWSNAATTSSISNLGAGTYSVTITDANGCTKATQATVINIDSLPTAAGTGAITGSGIVAFSQTSSANTASVKWSFGDGTSSFQKSPVHTYAANGTYIVTLVASNFCGSDTVTFEVTLTNVGIAEDLTSSLSLYPNPTEGNFALTFNGQSLSNAVLEMYSMDGKLVMTEMLGKVDGSATRSISLDRSVVATGVYTVRVSSAEGVMVKRLVIR